MPSATRTLPTVWIGLAQFFHHGEQFLALEPLHPGEMDQLSCPDNDCPPLWGPGDRDPPTPAEGEEALVPEDS